MKTKLKNLPYRVVRGISWRIRKKFYKGKEEHHGREFKFSHVTYYATVDAGDTALSQCVRREFEKVYDYVLNLLEFICLVFAVIY